MRSGYCSASPNGKLQARLSISQPSGRPSPKTRSRHATRRHRHRLNAVGGAVLISALAAATDGRCWCTGSCSASRGDRSDVSPATPCRRHRRPSILLCRRQPLPTRNPEAPLICRWTIVLLYIHRAHVVGSRPLFSASILAYSILFQRYHRAALAKRHFHHAWFVGHSAVLSLGFPLLDPLLESIVERFPFLA